MPDSAAAEVMTSSGSPVTPATMVVNSAHSSASMTRFKAPNFDHVDVLSNVEDHLVEQRRTDLLQRGEDLTLLCCGESGAGKTSLMNSLFAQKLTYANAGGPTLSLVESKTVLTFAHTSLKIELTTVDTPGYGDTLNLGDSFERVTEYITASFRRAMEAERRATRAVDENTGGVDAVLYFISPHRLKEVDVMFMRRLAPLASIVPIIAKADTYTRDELRNFRELVQQRLHEEGIAVVAPPFAVICSEPRNEHDETPETPGRSYPWGHANSENDDISDLPALRRFLVTDGLMKLHEKRRLHYETYRQNLALYRSELVEGLSTRLVKWSKSAFSLGTKIALVVVAVGMIGGGGGRIPVAQAATLRKGNGGIKGGGNMRAIKQAEEKPKQEEKNNGILGGLFRLLFG